MENSFNPYHEWLGIDPKISPVNSYQLLALDDFEGDAEKISAAADRAMSRVRSFKPGQHAPLWARLLDELETAKNCLLNSVRKSRYDADLAAGKPIDSTESDRRASESSNVAPQFKSTDPRLTSLMYPPGFGVNVVRLPTDAAMMASVSVVPVQTMLDPAAAFAPTAYTAPTPASAPFSSQIPPGTPDPMAPVGARIPSFAPAFDPMAPVAMPVATNSPLSYGAPMSAYNSGMPLAVPLAPVATPVAMGPVAMYPQAMSPLATSILAGIPVASSAAIPVAQLVSPADLANAAAPMGVAVGVGAATVTAKAGPLLSAAAPTPAVRSSSVGFQLAVERTRTSTQIPIILGVGGGLILLTVAIVYFNMSGSRKPIDVATNMPGKSELPVRTRDIVDGSTSKSKTTGDSFTGPPNRPLVLKTSTPKTTAIESSKVPTPSAKMSSHEDGPAPESKPTVRSPKDPPSDTPTKPTETPEPKPTLEPKPEPKPAEPPTPEKPAAEKPEPLPSSQPKPTKEQVHALAEALKNARTALGELDTDESSRFLTGVESLPKLPEHQAKYERLKQLTHYVREFHLAYNQAVQGLEANTPIQIGSTFVNVVELFPGQDKIILRVAGQNRTYRFKDLPVGLAVAIADKWLTKKDGATHVVKGAFVAAHRKSSEDMLKKAREWWRDAEREIPEVVKKLTPVLDDTYDLEKDLPGNLSSS